MKFCTKCKTNQLKTEFHKDSSALDKLQACCKQCMRAYQRQWMANRRAEFFDGKSCVECGSIEHLELDHVKSEQKVTHRVWSWSKVRRDAEIAKCQVLCETCHQVKSAHENSVRFTKPLVHGTLNGYKKKKCRCKLCAKAYGDYRKTVPSRQKGYKKKSSIGD